jgi:2-keto-3-deoxy-L-rhamnonate aldolase RhmA
LIGGDLDLNVDRMLDIAASENQCSTYILLKGMASSMYPACVAFKKELLEGAYKTGMFVQQGSALTTEIAARSGLDYVLLDQEHGLGSADVLLAQLMAVAGTPCFPIVRLPWLEAPQFKKVLDAGACGVSE